jgi:hypothetical protein
MAISIVHTTAANASPVTIPSTTAGNCLVVCIMSFNNVGAASVSGVTLGGAAGNFADVVDGHGANAPQFADAFIWADPNCAGGQTSVAVAGTNLVVTTGSGGIVVYEVSGLKSSAVVDQTNNGGTVTGTTWTSNATSTTTAASELWVGCADADTPAGPSAPWSNTSVGTGGVAGQQVVSSTGAATYNGTQTSSAAAAVVATFLPSLNVTGTLSVAMAPMKLSATGTETIPGTLSVAMAPLKMSATGTAAYVYIPQGLTTFGSGGGDRTGALWEQARTGEWQQAPGYGPVAPGSVPIVSGSPVKLVGRGYTGELAEPAHYTGPEWVPAVPYEPPPPAPPPPAGPGIRDRLRKIGAELYRIGGEIRPVSPYS